MRVGCLQFASRPGEVETNMKKAHDILDKVGKQTSTAVESNLDFLVLPKLAFSGMDHIAIPLSAKANPHR